MAQEADWIEWAGGASPIVLPRIELRYRDGNTTIYSADMLTDDGDWGHEESDPEGDIVAYRYLAA